MNQLLENPPLTKIISVINLMVNAYEKCSFTASNEWAILVHFEAFFC